MFALREKREKAYTLVEIITVFVIIGGVVAFAMPNIALQVEKLRMQEQIVILTSVYEAVRTYNMEVGLSSAPGTSLSLSTLDLDIPASDDFDYPVIEVIPTLCDSDHVASARVERKPNNSYNYSLHILMDGTIICEPCQELICLKLGFEPLSGS